ncbi:uncharacterized protein LOC132684919 isoform X1 [Panthera onca]|uniref:uncharacterized protein LOC132684919 isoform X1 n=1 Tax=Panthera onca TaxID=9690 RepID=UPI002953242D|nr:uncharacterized protein LOC132684919 isoform X1 [Panthera onca]
MNARKEPSQANWGLLLDSSRRKYGVRGTDKMTLMEESDPECETFHKKTPKFFKRQRELEPVNLIVNGRIKLIHSDWFRDGHTIQVGPMEVNSEIFAGKAGRGSCLSAGAAELYNVEPKHRAGRSHCMKRACQVEPIQRRAGLRER